MTYYEIIDSIRAGTTLDQIEVCVGGDWISWHEAAKELKSTDWEVVKYRIHQ